MALDFDGKNQKSGDDSWKSHAFLNMKFPTNQGGERKVGEIKLKIDNADHKAIIDLYAACTTDAERAAVDEKIRSAIIFDYRLAADPNRAELVL